MGWWDDLQNFINKGKNYHPNTSNIVGDVGRALTGTPSIPNSGSTTGFLGDIGKGIGDIGQSVAGAYGSLGMAGNPGLPQEPTYSLAEQLQQQLGAIQPHYTPLEQLQKQATNTVSAQYDPQIQNLMNTMSQTKTRGHKNEAKVKDMYNSLSSDFASQVPQMQHDVKASQDAVSARYKQAKTELQNQYNQQSTDQQNTLAQLGIQAASQDAHSQAATDQAYFQQQQTQDQNQTNNALAEQGNAQTDYQNNLAATTKQAGVNSAQDIATQLEQYLQGAQGQLSTLQGSKAGAIASLLGQLQQADMTRADTNYQHQFDNTMSMNNYQLNAQKAQNTNDIAMQRLQQQAQSQAAGGQLFKGTTGMSGLTNFLAQAYGNDTQKASDVSNLVTSVLQNPEVQSGQHNNSPITNDYVAALLRQAAAQQGVSGGTDLNNAIDAYLAYKGQLR